METYTTSRPLLDRRDRKDLPDRRGPLDRKVPLDQKGLLVLRGRRARLDPPDLLVILDRRVPKVRRGSRGRRGRREFLVRWAPLVRKGSLGKMVPPGRRLIRSLCRRDIRGQRRSTTIFYTLSVISMRFWMLLTGRWSSGDNKR